MRTALFGVWLLAALPALAAAGCAPEIAAVPAPVPVDAGCVPAPATCGATVDCMVEARDDGTRVCSGTACCQAFCDLNGCAACCAINR